MCSIHGGGASFGLVAMGNTDTTLISAAMNL